MSKQTEAVERRKQRASKILRAIRKLYPDARSSLDYSNALELLIATILSAQCTDARVNKVTPAVFGKYRTAADYAKVRQATLEKAIQSTGFYRNKAKHIRGACAMLVERFGGEVPDTMADLLALPGVARKTANCVLGAWFGKEEGVVVDTHVGRLAVRLGLTWTSRDGKDAVKIEADLMQVIPRKKWTYFAHAIVLHGRAVCTARKPKCDACVLAKACPLAGTFG